MFRNVKWISLFLLTLVGDWEAQLPRYSFVSSGSLFAQSGSAAASEDHSTEASIAATHEKRQQEIQALIDMLGSDNFASRRRAQMELEILGLDAFEALQEAFRHPDPEVAASARYLINSAQVEWANETDPPQVKEILRNYDMRSSAQRKALMDRLAALPRREGWEPLCRIAKYEPGNSLSKYAALLLMKKRKDLELDDRNTLVKLIETEVGLSRRAGAQWLRTFAKLIQETPGDLKDWMKIAESENALLDAGSEDTFPEVVQNLYQWVSIWSNELSQREDALQMARGAIRVAGNDPMGLRDAAYWVIDNGFPELVEEMQAGNQQLFAKVSELTYCLAESFRARKQEENAEEYARTAFENRSAGMLPTRDPRDFRTYRGFGLQGRGLFDWSEREYRAAIENTRNLDIVSLKARYFLGEMLHDGGRNQEASELWKTVLDELDKTGETFRQQLQVNLELAGFYDPAAIIGQAYLYQGLALSAQGDIVQARIKLNRAYELDADNADVLIAMYRLDGDQEWKKTVLQRIKICGEYFQTQINQKEQEMESAGVLGAATARKDLATMNNQYAWLISNTEGDFQQAIRYSLRSLELEPDAPGYLDTLGRCYYAAGEMDSAVKYQRRAVQLEPYAQAMKRQLKLFEAALEQQKGAAGKTP